VGACGIYPNQIYLKRILQPPVDLMTSTPLNPPVFHILLALAEGDLHGLGVADWVERTTAGAVELGPGTLYRSLKEMLEQGLVREGAGPRGGGDPRRKYYHITAEGRRRVAAEAARLERLVEVARERKLLPRRA
jgi:DNA-binding PadR family transcriptional regulator